MPLPTGPAVTFLFTDIEGSTRLERALGSASWAETVATHDALLRAAIEGHGGVVVKTEGDAFFAAFADAEDAIAGAVAAQRAIAGGPWPPGVELRVRMGLHLGEGRLRAGHGRDDPEDYVGIDVNYTARIAAAANGGQLIMSDAFAGALPGDLALIAGLGDVALVDEGRRSVKDFEDPVSLHRLVIPGAADDPRPLRTTEVPSNLPGEVTTLVGRDEEIGRLAQEMLATRILTLVGPGGSGKTRLAVAVARAIRERHPDGAWFVDLAGVSDSTLVETTMATTLGVRESVERPLEDALREHLRTRTILLVLDNLEQLLPDAAVVVARIVRSAPSLRMLVTSRELLHVTGEHGYLVPPLDADAGVALFIDRARALRAALSLDAADLAAIRELSERLGGLPLALELAAARVRLLSPQRILERLGASLDLAASARDVPERQRTLRGAFAWSHGLLPESERALFGRLGVFASGWTLASASAVVDPDGTLGVDLLAGLESLADKSLVRIEPEESDEPRFGLHPLLREFALERLEASGDRPATEARFARECAAIATATGPAILGATTNAALRTLDQEDRNLRAAVDWALANGAPDVGLSIVGPVWRWYQVRGRLREARAMLAQLLAQPGSVDPRARIAGLAAEGGLAYWMADHAAARHAYEERLVLAEATGDPVLTADGHYDLGFVHVVDADSERLRAHEQRALELYLAAGHEVGAVRARQALVIAVFLAGEYETAHDLELQNREAFERRGSVVEMADSDALLTAIAWRRGDLSAARRHVASSAQGFLVTDSASGLARVLAMAAIVLISTPDAELGVRAAGAAYRLAREKGVMLAPVTVLHLPEPRQLAEERFGPERAAELLAEGEASPIPDLVAAIVNASDHEG